MRACTIIAKNYLAQARVLAKSFLRHHPEGAFSVLIIDELEGLVAPDKEPFTVLTPEDVGCDTFRQMATRYTVLELSTAVKPWLLRHELALAPAVTYLDPDIQVFGSLESLDQRACESGLVLTPHNTEPIPDDGKRPTQIDIMIAGVYNLGYISVGRSREVDRFIGWWADRLQRDCRVDPVYGYFVDQRWFDLVSGFVASYDIVREPEFNVAYWNAHTRAVTHDGDSYAVNGRPLGFFHFSGFDPATPAELSRHQNRISLADHPPLAQLCAEYARAVRAEGYAQTRAWRYTYDWLADGTPYTPALRRLFSRAEDEGFVTANPFDEAGCEAFLSWAAEQQEGAPEGVNRALAAAYGTHPAIREGFPDLSGDGTREFLRWAAGEGALELDLPPRLLPAPAKKRGGATPVHSEPAAEHEAPIDEWGVNVIGYFRSELGVGEAARQVVRALDAADVSLLPLHGPTVPLSRQDHPYRLRDYTSARFPINLICMNADAVPEFAGHAGPEFFHNRYSIGLWFWEVVDSPADGWHESFRHLEEVWVATAHVAEAVSAVAPVPVTKVTIPIHMPPAWPVSREAMGLPEGFLFMFTFDYLSVFERKNPLAVIEAFKRAFNPGVGAALVIKCINHERDRVNHARLVEAAASHPDIHMIDAYLSPEVNSALTASCDCYVSLHRSEGFGLTMAEAMYLGKPVIATGYSGNLDFMTSVNSYLVDHSLVPIGPDAPPYPPDGRWAEPDVEQAATFMREVFTDREAAALRGKRGASDLRHTHSLAVAGAAMAQRLERIRPRPPSGIASKAVVPGLEQRVARGPVAPPRSPLGAVGRGGRRLMLRLMKPLSAYQHTVNQEIVRSLEALDAHVQSARVASDAEHLAGARTSDETRRDVNLLLSVHDRLNRAAETAHRIDREQRAIPYMTGKPFTLFQNPVLGRVEGFSDAGAKSGQDRYRLFEDIFRGPEEFIRDRQRKFLAVIGDREPVLDLGCGRGEFLDLLRESGHRYLGVDADPGMVARCQAKGHEVTLADGEQFVASLSEGSLGAIFCAQVVEHLPYEQLVRLLDKSRRALSPGGMLIAETVNPHSVPALKTFWVDLTHQHPIFPEVALALCLSAGFSDAYVFYPNGTGDVEADRYTQGEYAVVATVDGEDKVDG